MSTDFHHVPVLLAESVEYLHLKPGAVILDGTLGGGGHAEAILDRTGPDGVLVGLDLDDEALEASARRLAHFGDRVRFVRSSFRHLGRAGAEMIERDYSLDVSLPRMLDLYERAVSS